MGEEIVGKALTLSDSIFLVLLVAVAFTFWRFAVYVLKKNDDREQRYIGVIESQAKSLQDVGDLRDDVKEIKHYIYKKGRATQ